MAQKRPKVEPPHKINGSTLGLFWALFGIILGSFMVPLSHQRKLVAQLMAFFEYFLSYFEPFEPPIKVDGSTLGLFWALFGKFHEIPGQNFPDHFRIVPNECFLKVHVLKLILVPISNSYP
jgi:hypothetical protein